MIYLILHAHRAVAVLHTAQHHGGGVVHGREHEVPVVNSRRVHYILIRQQHALVSLDGGAALLDAFHIAVGHGILHVWIEINQPSGYDQTHHHAGHGHPHPQLPRTGCLLQVVELRLRLVPIGGILRLQHRTLFLLDRLRLLRNIFLVEIIVFIVFVEIHVSI